MSNNDDAKITVEVVKNAAHALGQINPDAEEICWGLGIHRPTQMQIAAVEKIMQQENL